MHGICEQTQSRRRFLKGGLAWAAGVATLGPDRVLGGDRDECTRWAFLSDSHIAPDPDHRHRGFHPFGNLHEIVGQIASDLPDGVIVTGDLAWNKGETGAYENLKSLLAPVRMRCPIYLGLGNHDDRIDFSWVFGGGLRDGLTVPHKHIATAVAGPLRLIVLDSLLIDRAAGLLGPLQRTWLKAFLDASDDRPTLLFLHHRPRIDLLDTQLLFDIIVPMANVKAVVFGHSHEFCFSEYQGIHLINLPAAGFSMSAGEPVGWVDARLTDRGGEFTLHALCGNRRLDGYCERLSWRV